MTPGRDLGNDPSSATGSARRADDDVVGEARWHVAGAVLAAMVLTILLPGTLRLGPTSVLLARENPRWGYLRIVDAPRKLGISISATSVRNILTSAGVPPAPQRDRQSWRSFIRAHGESILACDFSTVDTVWLRRLYVHIFLLIGSRRIEYVACTSNPDTAWMLQQARNLLMELGDREQQARFLIHDRDAKFPRAFDALLASEKIKVTRTPVQAPNASRVLSPRP